MNAKGLKIISLIILLAMILTTFGCNSTPEATIPPDNAGLQGENLLNQIFIRNIEDYNKFLQTNKENLPDDFLTVDMLKELGSLKLFIINENTADWDYYYYSLYHEDTYRISFRPVSSRLTAPMIDSSLIGPTMMSVTEKARGTIVLNGLDYYYKDGKLLYITWDANDKLFRLALTELLPEQRAELPDALSENSILRKLLSKDAEDQIAAYNQLVDMVTK